MVHSKSVPVLYDEQESNKLPLTLGGGRVSRFSDSPAKGSIVRGRRHAREKGLKKASLFCRCNFVIH